MIKAMVLLLTFSLIASVVATLPSVTVHAAGVTVPDDYGTIQEAINHAKAGDTVFVKNGFYMESIVIDKPLTLRGQSSQETMIVGPPRGHFVADQAILIKSNDVTVYSFCVEHTKTGIVADGVDDIRILGNNVMDTEEQGIHISGHDVVISGNNFTRNWKTGGIYAYQLMDASITNNTISWSYGYGVAVESSVNVTVSGNGIVSNGHVSDPLTCGLRIDNTSALQVFRNNFINNSQQVLLQTIPTKGNSTVAWGNDEQGNYWSNYNGTGPYVINQNNIDHYPLTSEAAIEQFDPSAEPTLAPEFPQASWLPIGIGIISIVVAALFLLVYVRVYKGKLVNKATIQR